MEISASNNILLKNILFGNVWFCSGQSNMVLQMNRFDVTYANDIEKANYPEIRQFLVPNLTSLAGPQNDLPAGSWKPAVGKDLRPFSAVAYFFAKKIHEKYKVPVGIINASVGGTLIEAWTSEQGLKDFPALRDTIEKNKDTAYLHRLTQNALSTVNKTAPPIDAGMNARSA